MSQQGKRKTESLLEVYK